MKHLTLTCCLLLALCIPLRARAQTVVVPAVAALKKGIRPPVFPGNLSEFLRTHCSYPFMEQEARNEGVTTVEFTVNDTGKATAPRIVHSSGYQALDAEAVRLVREMPLWKPGTYRGRPVALKQRFTVNFSFRHPS